MDRSIPTETVMENLSKWVNRDEHHVWRGRYLQVVFMVQVGDKPFYISIRDGRIEDIAQGPLLMRQWAFAVRGDVGAWESFWRPVPAPGSHDIFALAKRGEFIIEGDLHPFMAYLQYFKDLLAKPRLHRGEWHS